MNPELVANFHCACGENPLWDERRGLLFWCDIPTGRIFSFNPKTGGSGIVAELGRDCGAFTLEESGDLLLLLLDEAVLLNPDSGELKPLRNGFLRDTERFNDCIALPDGTVLAGTVDWSQKTRGGLFHIQHDFQAQRITGGSACSNGLGWTPDGLGLYWVDSTARKVWLFDFNRETNEIGQRREWLHAPEATPDGMTTDTRGDVWLTFYDGPYLRHYDPNARLVEQIDFPSRAVTSCIFGGEDLDELYVTTGGGKKESDENELSGGLFRLNVGARGMSEFRSRLSET